MARSRRRVRKKSFKARTAKQKAQLKRAQLISARKRKGKGKPKPVGRKRAKAAPVAKRRRASAKSNYKAKAAKAKSSEYKARRRKVAKRVGTGVAVAGALGGAALVYKNREQLVIKHVAEYRAVRDRYKHNRKYFNRGITLSEIKAERLNERELHAKRSTLRFREYRSARQLALGIGRGLQTRNLATASLRPGNRSGSYWEFLEFQGKAIHPGEQRKLFEDYRKDVHSRARSRLAKRKGSKRGFNYSSGKRLLVDKKGRVKQAFW